MNRPRIGVVGSNMMDLITTVSVMPRKGETVEAPSFDMGFGGKGANQAVAAALLGAQVVMVTGVGDDLFGGEVKRNFQRYGIDTSFVKTIPGVSSGVAPIFVDSEGNNSILIVKGANNHLLPGDVEQAKEALKGCDLLLLQLEIPLETVYAAVDLGAGLGIPVLLNPAPAAPLDPGCLEKIHVLVPNETELESLAGMPVDSEEDARRAAEKLLGGVSRVIVTLGGRGALVVDHGGSIHVPATPVSPRDTTGAGDAFIGSFAFFYVRSGDLEGSVRRAGRYAALSTLSVGTQKSFYSYDQFRQASGDQTI
ncbi:MAG: ribokinase [Spirochaetota bacterium]